MPNNDDHSHDDVGYAKPPKHAQFPKGVSGNPRGRPKGKRNLATVLTRILQEKVVINENGKRKTVTKLEAAVKQLANKAASGDLLAMRLLTALAGSPEIGTAEARNKGDFSEADQKVISRLLDKLQKPEEGENDGNDN
jgi:hypothetical protein